MFNWFKSLFKQSKSEDKLVRQIAWAEESGWVFELTGNPYCPQGLRKYKLCPVCDEEHYKREYGNICRKCENNKKE